jgi:predicted DNA-binding transcriptional regulator AlpA
MPPTTLDRARKEDPRFPRPIVQGGSRNAPLRFILAEIYEYSAQLIAEGRGRQEVA